MWELLPECRGEERFLGRWLHSSPSRDRLSLSTSIHEVVGSEGIPHVALPGVEQVDRTCRTGEGIVLEAITCPNVAERRLLGLPHEEGLT